ncbi:MAG: Cof-type HAD-IIB family hydrolase [Oscillospiraceae bacterium]
MIKLIALDIDGTLLTSERKISQRTHEALHMARKHGCEVVLATGRAFMSLQDVMALAGCIGYAITSNGGGIFRADGTMLFASNMPGDLVRAVMKATSGFGIYPEVYIRGQAYASGHQLDNMHTWGVPEKTCGYILQTRVRIDEFAGFAEESIGRIEGMDVLLAPTAIRAGLRGALEKIQGLAVSSSSPYYVDANAIGITKASGLEHLGKISGVEREEIMAFGDAENDREMLSFAGTGVAMGNCVPMLRKHADYITDDNDSDGIAKALEYFNVI